MTIQPGTAEDLGAIGLLYEELNARMAALQPDNFRPARQNDAWILSQLTEENSDFLTARTNEGTVIGFALLQFRDTPNVPSFIPRRYTYLMDLVVTESCRGQGVGKALLAEVERWARAWGSEFIELGVLSENTAALRVYESCGYTERRKVMGRSLN